MDVAPSTLYRYIRNPSTLPRHMDLLLTAAENFTPDTLDFLSE